MGRRRRGALAIALGCMFLASGACAAAPRPSNPSVVQTFLSAAVRGELESRWVEVASGAGGFASTTSLTAAGSLYATSWNLRLLRLYRLPLPPALDLSSLERWLVQVATEPAQQTDSPPLETAFLAVRALADIGAPLPNVDPTVAASSVVGGYSYDPSEPASWAAAATVADLLAILGRPVPRSVIDRLTQALASLSQDAQVQDAADQLLPAWHLADLTLSSGERASYRPQLASTLGHLWTQLASQTSLSGQVVGTLSEIREIAMVNGIALPDISPGFFDPLELPDGYLSFTAGSFLPDPQVTYKAAALGRPMNPQLAAVIATPAPLGWSGTSALPDPASTYFATRVLHLAGDTQHDAELRTLIGHWLAGVPAQLADASELQSGFYVLAAAHEVGVELSGPLAIAAPDSAGETLAWVARLLLLTGQPASPGVIAQLRTAERGEPASTMTDAFNLWLLCRVTGDDASCRRALQAAQSLAEADGTYRFSTGTTTPDVRSTAMGLDIAAAGSVDRLRAAASFRNDHGLWLLPPGVLAGNNVTIESIFLDVASLDPTSAFAIP